MNTIRPAWSQQVRLIVVLMLIVIAGIFLYLFRSAIIPVILAIILAFILSPLVNAVQRVLRIRRRFIAVLLVYLLLLLVLSAVLRIVIPLLLSQVSLLQEEGQELYPVIKGYLGQTIIIAGFTIDVQTTWDRLAVMIQALLNPLLGQSFKVFTRFISTIVWTVFIVAISVYLVKDSAEITKWFEERVPPVYRRDFLLLKDDIYTIWSAFFRGQLLLSLIVMVIMTIIAFSLGLRYALLLGILAGLLEFLPGVGHSISLALAVIVALIGGSSWIPIPTWTLALIVAGFHVIFQQFDWNYLIPRIIGRSVHLSPMVVILGVVAGASLTGLLGVVLAAPTIASVRVFGRYIYAQLFNLEPFPNSSTITSLPAPDLHWWQHRTKKPPTHEGQAPL
jgi:predicted PurR-regulated permease PerM